MSDEKRENEIFRVTIVGSIVNIILLVFKFIAGIVGHSSAMVADAVHSLSDFITDIVVIVFVRISSMPADKSHDYGHGKYETLASSIIGLVLLGVGAGIFIEGLKDIVAVIGGETLQKPGIVALIAAAVSILSKEILYRYTVHKGKKVDSQVVVANAWHHRSDALSSIGTLIGIGGAIIGGEQWRVLDPIAAVIVSFFIVKVAYDILKNSLQELMEHSLPDAIEEEIEQIILSVEGVESPHKLRTRRMGNTLSIEVHIRMNGEICLMKAHNTTTIVENKLRDRFGKLINLTIHTEPIKRVSDHETTDEKNGSASTAEPF